MSNEKVFRKPDMRLNDIMEKSRFVSIKYEFSGGYAHGPSREVYWTPIHGFYGWSYEKNRKNQFERVLDTDYVVYVNNAGLGKVPVDVIVPATISKDGTKVSFEDKKDLPIESVKKFLVPEEKGINFNLYKLSILTSEQTRKVRRALINPLTRLTRMDPETQQPMLEEIEITTKPLFKLVKEDISVDPANQDFDHVYPCFRAFFSKSNLVDGFSGVVNANIIAEE